MQLYEKQANGRYKPYTPPLVIMPEIESKQVITLLTALSISMLMSVYEQLPSHAAIPRKIKKVEEAIRDLALLNCEPLDDALIDVGVCAWNGAIHAMQVGLSGGTHD